MKTRDAWNKLYIEHGENVPWAAEPELNKWYIEVISKYLKQTPQKQTLLDYGCGLGQVAEHFRQKGFQIELADLSEVITAKLIKKYQNKVPVYLVTAPKDITNDEGYDVILAIGVFHHVNPDNWTSFLEDFYKLLKKDGTVFIFGWDKTDEEISNIQESLFTHLSRWSVNDLPSYINPEHYEIMIDDAHQIKFNSLPFPRTMHYFVLKKK